MADRKINPLNDLAFFKGMGEKGDEEQLISFLNAVLKRTGKNTITSVEILEDRDLVPDAIGDKAGKLDVLAKLADGTRVNIEVQLTNEYNMEKRTLDYWSQQFVLGIKPGQDYHLLTPVICINILGFGYIGIDDFHTSFHIYEDQHKDYMLTDSLEIHFLDMVKFRKFKGKDIVHEPLHRWLVYLDKNSPINLIEEVLKMDAAIQMMQEKMDIIQRDESLFRAYLRLEKAASDEVTRINGAKREGSIAKAVEIAKKMKDMGLPLEQITQATGLSSSDITKL
jgi:predicted transposase/invertase (TIGR01784 family)